MLKSHASNIRAILREHPDGLTARDIASKPNGPCNKNNATRCLKSMPDAYIDQWAIMTRNSRGQYSAIWCVVPVPENCPHPTRQEITE